MCALTLKHGAGHTRVSSEAKARAGAVGSGRRGIQEGSLPRGPAGTPPQPPPPLFLTRASSLHIHPFLLILLAPSPLLESHFPLHAQVAVTGAVTLLARPVTDPCYAYACPHAHAHARTHAHAHARTQARTRVRTHTRTHKQTHTTARTHTHTRTRTRTRRPFTTEGSTPRPQAGGAGAAASVRRR